MICLLKSDVDLTFEHVKRKKCQAYLEFGVDDESSSFDLTSVRALWTELRYMYNIIIA